MNQAIVVGRVGKEPKVFEGKSKMVSFRVATDSGFGENKQTIWENITVYGKLAETCEKYVTKGKLVFVSGRRESKPGKDGKAPFISIVANEVRFLEKPSKKEEQADDEDDGIPL